MVSAPQWRDSHAAPSGTTERHTRRQWGCSYINAPRKGMAQRQGESSKHLKVFERRLTRDCRKLVTDYLADWINCFGGYHAKNHHGNKPTAARETSGVIALDAGTQWSVLHCFSTSRYPLRWTGSITGDPSPCLQKTLRNRGWHTHFDNGFAVDSIPRSKRVKERKGEWVRKLEDV